MAVTVGCWVWTVHNNNNNNNDTLLLARAVEGCWCAVGVRLWACGSVCCERGGGILYRLWRGLHPLSRNPTMYTFCGQRILKMSDNADPDAGPDEPTVLSVLPDDLLLQMFLLLSELEDWPSSALVCHRWRLLLAGSRTRIKTDLSSAFDSKDARADRLGRALASASNSRQPIVQLTLLGQRSSDWSAADLKQIATIVSRSGTGSSLEILELIGPHQNSSASMALDDLLLAASKQDGLRALRKLDLSWNGVASSEPLAALLDQCAVAAVATPPAEDLVTAPECLHTLRLAGHHRLDDEMLRTHIEPLAPALRDLSLAACSSLDAGALATLVGTRCSSLTSLDLSFLRLRVSALRVCLSSPQLRRGLRTFGLAGFTGLPSDAYREVLCACESLTSIDFSASLLADAALRTAAIEAPAHLSRLQHVRLSECSSLTDAGVRELCNTAGGSLTALALGGAFSPLGDGAAQAIGSRCNAPLTRLELPACHGLGFNGVGALAPVAGSLTHLDLSDASELLTEAALGCILKRSGPGCGARLRGLVLRSCDLAVTDELLASFLPRAHGLRVLDLAYCTGLSDLTAILIAGGRPRGLRNLRRLDVTGINRFTAKHGQAALLKARGAAPGAMEMVLLHSFYDD